MFPSEIVVNIILFVMHMHLNQYPYAIVMCALLLPIVVMLAEDLIFLELKSSNYIVPSTVCLLLRAQLNTFNIQR